MRLAVYAALSFAALLNARIAFGPIDRIVSRATVDDTFLYLQIARNWARLGIPTFDGEVVTSGFQPLWGTILAGVAAVFPDADALVRATCLLCIVLNLATGVLLHRLMERDGPPGSAAITGMSWAAFMVAPKSISGMEAPLHGFLFAAAMFVATSTRLSHTARVTVAACLLAAATLARIDFAVVAIPLGIWIGLRSAPRHILAAIAPFAVILPLAFWLFYAWTGDVFPVSGRAKLFWAHEAYPVPGWSTQIAQSARMALAVAWEMLHWMTGLRGFAPLLLSVLACALGLAGLVGIAQRVRRDPFASTVAAALVLLALSAIVTGILLRQFAGNLWYYQPLRVVIAIIVGFSVVAWRATAAPAVWIVATALFGLGLGSSLLTARGQMPNELYLDRIRAARWIAEDGGRLITGPVGSWNAGQLGYFSFPHTVVSLDGLVQNGAFIGDVLETGDWRRYLERRGIRYLVDYNRPDATQAFFASWNPQSSFRGIVPLECAILIRQFGQISVLDVSRWVSASTLSPCAPPRLHKSRE